MLGIFTRQTGEPHPLADPKAVTQLLAELPARGDMRSLDELAGWMESLVNADGLAPPRLFDIARQLDNAAQAPLRHLTRAYLAAPNPSAPEAQKAGQLCLTYAGFAADVFQLALDGYEAIYVERKNLKVIEPMRPHLPLLLSRLIALRTLGNKWHRYRHEAPPVGYWSAVGRAFLFAETRRIDSESVTLYPASQIVTSPRREYVKAVVLEASSLDSVLPVQIEVAEKLVAHFSPLFVLSRESRRDNIYWVDAASDVAPHRLARLPQDTPGVRLLALGDVPGALAAMTHVVERGELPSEVNLSLFTPKLVLSSLRHLASYWTPKPPVRAHQRHAVASKLIVENGFEVSFERLRGSLSSGADELDFRPSADIWQVGDVSMGGFGARVSGARRPWLRIGALLTMQSEGSDKWMVGVVRRCQRGNDNVTAVGVQTLARQVSCHEFEVSGGVSRGGRERGIVIDLDGSADSVRVILPSATFDLNESYSTSIAGRRVLLSPIELVESGVDFQIGRFRVRYAD